VVKSLLLSPEKSFARKIREAILAFKIEKYLTKEEILFMYLNQIYLGHGAYGVSVAAENYFGKSIEGLNLAESALLAGLPQAPSKYSPLNHPDQARKRQQYVLYRMVEIGFISDGQLGQALQLPLTIKEKPNSLRLRIEPPFCRGCQKVCRRQVRKKRPYTKRPSGLYDDRSKRSKNRSRIC
jgi:penicillin-binding protein 1A